MNIYSARNVWTNGKDHALCVELLVALGSYDGNQRNLWHIMRWLALTSVPTWSCMARRVVVFAGEQLCHYTDRWGQSARSAIEALIAPDSYLAVALNTATLTFTGRSHLLARTIAQTAIMCINHVHQINQFAIAVCKALGCLAKVQVWSTRTSLVGNTMRVKNAAMNTLRVRAREMGSMMAQLVLF